jgi:glycogen(starch) synthase
MRILYWVDGFWPRIGGIETQLLKSIEEFQRRGHEVSVIAQWDNPSWKEAGVFQGIFIKRFDFNSILAKRDLKVLRSIQAYLEKLMGKFKPDLIHLHASVGGSAFAFTFCLHLLKIPIIQTLYSPYLHENALPPIIGKIAGSVDRICCISDWVVREMERYLPSIKGKCKRIYCGLSMPQSFPLPLSILSPTLLLFGRLSKEKGFDTGIEAFARLKQAGSKARLIVAGGGPERQNLEKLVDERGIRDSVEFTGVLSEEERLAVLNRATLVIVPSRIESFGLVILESMQMQRPVIATRIEGIPEVVSEGKTGLLVPMEDPNALCQAIQTLLNQPDRAIEMGLEGRRRAALFSMDKTASQYEAIYKELTGLSA